VSGAADNPATVTSTQLLDGLRGQDDAVWSAYVDRYRPVLVGYARKLSLSAEDAEDVAQRALVAFHGAYVAGKYEREKGRLRDWLFGIARHQIMDFVRKRRRGREVKLNVTTSGGDFFERLEDEKHLQTIWEQEWREGVVRACLQRVRDEVDARTMDAFALFAQQGWSAERVGESLNMSPNAVFGAKRRVLRRVRELLPAVEDAW
jgi:RNA polymerase sigma-70 factor (ECF subfamily)